MRRRALFAAVVSLIVFTNAGRAQDKKEQPGKGNGPLLLKAFTIKDVPRNNSQLLSTVLVPADWRAESDMKWTLASATVPFALRARFSAPDGTSAVEFFAIPQGARNTSPLGTQGSVPADVIAALSQLAQSSRPNARLEVLEKKASEVEKIKGQQGLFAQTGRIRFAYQENGQTLEEEFAGTLYIMITSLGQGYETRHWYIDFPRSIKAAQGKLNDLLPIGQAVCRSARPTPEFLKAIQVAAQVKANLRKQDQELTRLEGQMWLDATRQTNDAWRQVCDERWAADQKIAEGRRDILGGVRRFVDGAGRDVTAPVTYNHLWGNGQGYYLLTNDGTFRPGPEFQGTWTQLRPKQ